MQPNWGKILLRVFVSSSNFHIYGLCARAETSGQTTGDCNFSPTSAQNLPLDLLHVIIHDLSSILLCFLVCWCPNRSLIGLGHEMMIHWKISFS